MLSVPLRDNLANQLKNEAERLHTSVEALANDWLEDQLWQAKRRKINEEADHFRARHTELFAQYNGQYIAMRDGVVLDHDANLVILHGRIRAQYGDEPILIAPVTAEPIQTFKVLGARRRGG
ncbi:MAG: hypothetical protein HY868_07460 [Chloroflexi bacterium]|nr:hypothetical protein [Chloroflexota bacterium]